MQQRPVSPTTSERSRPAAPFLTDYLPYLLHRADQLISSDFHDDLRESGIQMSEWRVLAVLHDHGACAIGVLTDETLLPQPTVTHTVARLEERGDVERIAGTADRRQRIVSLTRSGEAVVERLLAQAGARQAGVTLDAGIDADELRATLHELIRRLEARPQR